MGSRKRIVVDGKEYRDPAEMPPDVREAEPPDAPASWLNGALTGALVMAVLILLLLVLLGG